MQLPRLWTLPRSRPPRTRGTSRPQPKPRPSDERSPLPWSFSVGLWPPEGKECARVPTGRNNLPELDRVLAAGGLYPSAPRSTSTLWVCALERSPDCAFECASQHHDRLFSFGCRRVATARVLP